ncbi:hypothetical protein EJB05_22452, partial [Eragrostis curvula]
PSFLHVGLKNKNSNSNKAPKHSPNSKSRGPSKKIRSNRAPSRVATLARPANRPLRPLLPRVCKPSPYSPFSLICALAPPSRRPCRTPPPPEILLDLAPSVFLLLEMVFSDDDDLLAQWWAEEEESDDVRLEDEVASCRRQWSDRLAII